MWQQNKTDYFLNFIWQQKNLLFSQLYVATKKTDYFLTNDSVSVYC